MRRIAHEGGFCSSRYYSLAGRSLLAACPIVGHFAAPRGSRCPRLLLQVNTGEEPQKAGVLPGETAALIAYARAGGKA